MMWTFLLGLVALTLLAVAFVLYPAYRKPPRNEAGLAATLRAGHAMRRDEIARDVEAGWLDARLFVEAEEELDRGMLNDAPLAEPPPVTAAGRQAQRGAWGLAALVVVLALGLLPLSSPLVGAVVSAAIETSPDSELEALQAQVEATPNAAAVWMDLGQLHLQRGEAGAALAAYTRAVELTGHQDADALVRLADAQARHAGDVFSAAAVGHLEAALALDGKHQGGLWLAGFAAAQQGRTADAQGYWQRLLALVPPEDAETRALLTQSIAELTDRGTAITGPSIAVRVAVAPALTGSIDPNATLFVYARRPSGPPMPLVIWRGQARDLPVEVLLDDRLALIEGAGLASSPRVVVAARISRSGLATLASGDITGHSAPLTVGIDGAVTVTLDTVAP